MNYVNESVYRKTKLFVKKYKVQKGTRLVIETERAEFLARDSKLNVGKSFPYIRINNDDTMEIIIAGESTGSVGFHVNVIYMILQFVEVNHRA